VVKSVGYKYLITKLSLKSIKLKEVIKAVAYNLVKLLSKEKVKLII